MMGMDIDRYVNNFNRGCKVISFGKPLCDVNGMEEQLNKNVQYRRIFVGGVTDIGPTTVVGPISNGKLGKENLVCVQHWRESVA
jgi:hypothetical protein